MDLLNTLVAETEEAIQSARTDLDTAEQRYHELLESSQELTTEYNQLLTWADLYETSTFETKKMIVSQFVKAVRVGRDYNIEVDFNVSFEEFQNFSMEEKKIS